eukprot:scaffold33692_cov59-Attheya_sp.AAC.5
MVTRNAMTFQAALIATSLLIPLAAGFSTSTSLLASQIGKLDHVSPRTSAYYPQVVRTTFPRKRSLWMSTVVTPGTESPDGSDNIFEPLGVGIKRDFRRRLPHYKSDITDGMNAQSLATTLFLFFACLAPAIGFGGILDTATNGAMGAIEMVSSTAFCGTFRPFPLSSYVCVVMFRSSSPQLFVTTFIVDTAWKRGRVLPLCSSADSAHWSHGT